PGPGDLVALGGGEVDLPAIVDGGEEGKRRRGDGLDLEATDVLIRQRADDALEALGDGGDPHQCDECEGEEAQPLPRAARVPPVHERNRQHPGPQFGCGAKANKAPATRGWETTTATP